MKILEFDSPVPSLLFKKLHNIVHDKNFPWYYISNSAYDLDYDNFNKSLLDFNYSFSHSIFNENGYTSSFSPLFESAFFNIIEKADLNFNKIFRIRLGLLLGRETLLTHIPHVDMVEKHSVCLLYFDDVDGDTIIYENKFDSLKGEDSFEQSPNLDNKKILKVIKPQANKVVIFDGLHYHSSSLPTKFSKRVVMNVNFY